MGLGAVYAYREPVGTAGQPSPPPVVVPDLPRALCECSRR